MVTKKIPNHSDEPQAVLMSEFQHSEFVHVLQNEKIFVDMKYPKLGMKYAESACLLRKEVYDKLLLAQQNLPDGYHIKIWDAWRPLSLQREIFNTYFDQIIEKFDLENKSKEEKIKIIKKYISLPKKSAYEHPVHTSGGAVDVTLADQNGKEFFMGTEFDELTQKTQTNYYEFSDNEEVKKNRRILYNAMISAGFTNLPSEWWHYDYGDRFWAFYKNKPIIYAPIYEKDGVKFEDEKKSKTD